MLSEFRWDQSYAVPGVEDVLTPALVLYPDLIAANIERTLELLDGDAGRWRVHIKTAKLGYTLRLLVKGGVRNFKCATTLELLVACQSGAADAGVPTCVVVGHPELTPRSPSEEHLPIAVAEGAAGPP